MHRRSLVRAGCSSFLFLLPGCGGHAPDDTPPSQTDSPRLTATSVTSTESATRTREPTTSEQTPRQRAEVQHELGTPHRVRDWDIAVASLDLTTKFQRDGLNAVFEIGGDRQLLVATLRVTNVGDSRHTWSGWPIVAIVDNRVFEDQLAFEYASSDDPLGLKELESVEHVRRLYPEGYQVDSGETFRSWYLFVLPLSVSRGQVQIGLDDAPDDDISYPIRWVSDSAMTPSNVGHYR